MDFQEIVTFTKKHKIIIIIFIIALVLRLIFVYSMPVKIWDETIYSNLGYHLSQNILDYSFKNTGWSDFVPSGGNLIYNWPNAGFRAPLLPYILSLFYFLKISFLIEFIMPFIGALSVILIFILGKKLFNEKIALISSLFFALIPLHTYYSGKILTDVFSVFFILLTILFFWKGFEENSNYFKLLFGILFAFSLLARYSSLWFIPIFFFYLLLTRKNLLFLKDKYLWFSITLFFIILAPFFIYSFFTYNNFLGALIHASKASIYWGGSSSWYFYFKYWLNMFSIIGIVFLFSLIYIFYKKDFLKKPILFVILWFLIFLIMALMTQHKEDRYIMSIVPSICLISSYGLSKLDYKFNNKLYLIIIFILIFSNFFLFYNIYTTYNNTNSFCFKETVRYINHLNESVLMVTENPPITFYYTHQESSYYPTTINITTLNEIKNSSNKRVLFVFNKLNSGLENEKYGDLKELLQQNYNLIFNCTIDSENNFIYS
ncbi:MAG TPA: glycosyltransferase family 39 protein [Candidatus Nanoarchaeia archaeon]|nr:glycosyltransferase family 39 protein [Candidatus Nanoarchaeia archaeon]